MTKYDCPVGFTCQDIDDAITDAEKASEYLDNAVVHINELIGKFGSLEALRDQNSTLRKWGEEMAEKVKDLENEIENLELEIENLNEEINSLKSK